MIVSKAALHDDNSSSTNIFDAANRLVESSRDEATIEPIYNGINDRVGQTVGVTTTYFALDVADGLPEVIQTNGGNNYLHLPGVIVAESAEGEVRYLLSDGLGSIRQAVDENAQVMVYNEFDPYGNPISQSSNLPAFQPYGYTGEWWEDDVALLHLRARWYSPETGTFLSRDPVEGEPPYQYVRGNPINRSDPSGFCSPDDEECWAVYNEIIELCPECADAQGSGKRHPDGTLLRLYEEDTAYLKNYLEIRKRLSGPELSINIDDIIEIYNAAYRSHSLKMDGLIFGVNGSFNAILLLPFGDVLGLVEVNDICLPSTGLTWGGELVYDFKHQERGFFLYGGPNLNINTLGGVGGVVYLGYTRGFAYQPYEEGVLSYGGYFNSLAVGLSAELPDVPTASGGVTAIESVPLDDEKNVKNEGVFATYIGLSAGASQDIIPWASADWSTTWYWSPPAMIGRERYIPLYLDYWWPDFYEEDVIISKKYIPNRRTTARIMQMEIETIFSEMHAIAAAPFFTARLWEFVDDPEVEQRPQ